MNTCRVPPWRRLTVVGAARSQEWMKSWRVRFKTGDGFPTEEQMARWRAGPVRMASAGSCRRESAAWSGALMDAWAVRGQASAGEPHPAPPVPWAEEGRGQKRQCLSWRDVTDEQLDLEPKRMPGREHKWLSDPPVFPEGGKQPWVLSRGQSLWRRWWRWSRRWS